ncbi:MAG: HD-like signal output (HDOD) protein [Myxococcota bacterium]|jgi:HD-like signal output (HDOD) protein
MALTAWINRLLPSRAPAPVVVARKAPAANSTSSLATDELVASLESMEEAPGEWCTTAPPSSDLGECRAWLREEVQQWPERYKNEEGVTQLAEHLLDTLSRPDLRLPPPPSSALRLFKLLQDEEVRIHTVCEELRQEPALVQRVWAQASSAHFATKPRDLQYAIARVGLRELSRIAVAEVVSAQAFSINVMRHRAESARHRSILASELASRCSPRGDSEAYLSGLLHAVGSLIVLRTAPIETPALDRIMPRLLRQLEAPLGLVALSAWSLPPAVTMAVGFQAEPDAAPAELRALTTLTRAASIAAHGAEMMMQGIDCGALDKLRELDGLPDEPENLLLEASQRLKHLLG